MFKMLPSLLFFSIVVVAEKALYTTTTSRLRERLLFGFGVWFGLQAGCEHIHKQLEEFA